METTIRKQENIDFWQDMVTELIVENKKAVGVKTMLGII